MPFTVLIILALSAGKLLAEDVVDRQLPLPPAPTCIATYPYRTYDGTCNNLNNPRYGQGNTIYQRLMGPAAYANGVSSIRLSESGGALPSTRLISTTVTVNESISENDASLMTMQWGQFMDHDLTQTPAARTATGGTISCCIGGRFGNFTPNPHPECLPIAIPSNDPTYSNVNCLNMVRNAFGLNLDGTIPDSRQQINALTHWIDGSQIYGNNDVSAQNLRDTSTGKGLLKVSVQGGRTLLPLTNTCCPGDPTNSCPEAQSCFIAGDSRVREQPLLTIMHTIWVREHNRVANELFNIFGTGKTDEFYYQEARRIVIAEFQHINYNEYLPTLLGPTLGRFLSTTYKSQANPAIYNEFAAAAYRMGHSQVRSFIRLYEADGTKSRQSYFVADSFNTGAFRLLNPTFIDNALRGLTRSPAQSVDECFADDLTSQLFRTPGTQLGGDLISINMQRGRDHGLPPYVTARQIVQGNMPSSFDDLASTHSPDVINLLKKVYATVGDIDLYIGGVTEKHIPGALVGPTFGYIISKQFENLKRADRFFYSYLTKSVSFNANQLNEIKKTSLSRIICDNSDGSVVAIQPNAFRIPSAINTPVPCTNLKEINFIQFYKTGPFTPSSDSSEDRLI